MKYLLFRFISLFVCLAASLNFATNAHASPVSASHRVLMLTMQWERGVFGVQFAPMLAAFKSAGYAVDDEPDSTPPITSGDLLARYDMVCVTTASAQLSNAAWYADIRDYVRQGGALLLVVTAGTGPLNDSPYETIMPCILDSPIGPGWGIRATWSQIKARPAPGATVLSNLDWASAPPFPAPERVPTPDQELLRGTLALMEPRESLVKPLMNWDWQPLLVGDDTENTPLAASGTYGRGRVIVWGPGLGGDPNHNLTPDLFVTWPGLTPLWSSLLQWMTAPGKATTPEPRIFVCGTDADNPSGENWTGVRWQFQNVISYPLCELGMVGVGDAQGADGALLLAPPTPAQATQIAALSAAGSPVMVCDPAAFAGPLAPFSPFVTSARAAAPAEPAITLGQPATVTPVPAAPAKPVAVPVTTLAYQPPTIWKFNFTNDPCSARDLRGRWQSPSCSDAGWITKPTGDAMQSIAGKSVPYTGAVWYRASVNLPRVTPTVGWLITSIHYVTPAARIDAWVDGKWAPLIHSALGIALPISSIGAGRHLLAIRIYSEGGATYWTGSQSTYDNVGMQSISAVQLPLPQKTIVTAESQAPNAPPLPSSPLLFTGKPNGDHAFHFTFTLNPTQAALSPLLTFQEPGLIKSVTVNGHVLTAINAGAWDGVTGGNTTAFLLSGVLKPGDNTLDFYPDFQRLRGMNYPLEPDAEAPCSLPMIEFTGKVQSLTTQDAALAPLVPSRLFQPGTIQTPLPGCDVLVRWNDGRPALVRRGNILAWTANVTAEMNSAVVQAWQLTREASGAWEFNAADNTPRGDSLVFENLAPLACEAFAQEATHPRVALTGIRRHGRDRSVDLMVANTGASLPIVISYRIFDWMSGIVVSGSKTLTLNPGETVANIAVPDPQRAGSDQEDRYLVRAAVRAEGGAVGLAYAERIVNLQPTLSLSIQTDSLAVRRASGSIPVLLHGDPTYRGRHLWWPLIDYDQGSSVYADGETCHATITVTNHSDAPVNTVISASFTAALQGQTAQAGSWPITLQPGASQSFPVTKRLTDAFESYILSAQCKTGDVVLCNALREVISVAPNKVSNDVDVPATLPGTSFTVYHPETDLGIPDNLIPMKAYDNSFGDYASFRDWTLATATGTIGNGGGVLNYTGVTAGLAWGPFFKPVAAAAPNQMSTMPNGEPYMHYIAEGIHRQQSDPTYNVVADFWGNYWVPLNWSTAAAFADWLKANDPSDASGFHPHTLAECDLLLAHKYGPAWNRWQDIVVPAAWHSVEAATPAGSAFWAQAELMYIAMNGETSMATGAPYDSAPILQMLAERDLAGDADPGTSRMGYGYRFLAYGETATAAMASDAHFNPTPLRHKYSLNEQRFRNQGNPTAESYRAEAYDRLYSAIVRPDGSLREMLDTPTSETIIYPNEPASGLMFGDRLYDRLYRLQAVLQPQAVLGLLWVAPMHRDPPGASAATDQRSVYETLRDFGVSLPAMISSDNLAKAPLTKASGVVWLLPYAITPTEAHTLKSLAQGGFPVVCLVSPEHQHVLGELPAGVKVVNLPADISEVTPISPRQAQALADAIHIAAPCGMTASENACVTGFRANGREFVVVQNMLPVARTVDIDLTSRIASSDTSIRAVDLDSADTLVVRAISSGSRVMVNLGPWDAHLIAVSGE